MKYLYEFISFLKSVFYLFYYRVSSFHLLPLNCFAVEIFFLPEEKKEKVRGKIVKLCIYWHDNGPHCSRFCHFFFFSCKNSLHTQFLFYILCFISCKMTWKKMSDVVAKGWDENSSDSFFIFLHFLSYSHARLKIKGII